MESHIYESNHIFFVPSKSGVCFQSCGSPIIKSCWSSKSDSGESQSLCQIPRLGNLDEGSEPHKVGELLWYYISSLWGHPLSRYGIWILLCLCPPVSLCGFALYLDMGYLFGGSAVSSPVNGCSAASCNFVLAGVRAHILPISAILNQSPYTF